MKRCAPIVALSFAFLFLLLFLTPAPIAQASPPASPRMPIAAQSLVSATLGRDTPGYLAMAAPEGYRLDNAAQHLAAEFDTSGLRVSSGEFTFGLGLQAVGYAASLNAMGLAEPVALANRIEYQRGDLTEWYVNGPLGVEQGFTLVQPPAGERQGALTLSLAWSGNLEPTLEESGTGLVLRHGTTLTALRYTGLAAYDATGRGLRAWLELDRSGVSPALLIRVEDTDARYPLTIDPYVLQATLTNSSGAANDHLGDSIAVSADGTTLVAGAYAADGNKGAAYVFVKGTSWATTSTPTAILTNSSGVANDIFGDSVAVSADGSTIAVGASGVNTGRGAAYVFAKGTGSWATTNSPTAILTNSSGGLYSYLGRSIAISADGATVVAGAWGENTFRGAAYIFAKGAANWATTSTPTAILTNSTGVANDSMGRSVAISADGSTIVTGAYGVKNGLNNNAGAAYIFIKASESWTTTSSPTAILTHSSGVTNDSLGRSVAVSADGTTVVAGAHGVDRGLAGDAGAAYVFVKGASWATTDNPTAILTNSLGASNDYLGKTVAISADGATVVAGAPGVNIGLLADTGAAYVFTKGTGSWATMDTPAATLTHGASGDTLGDSVAVSANGATIVAGASGASSGRGAAYVFFQPFSSLLYLPLLLR